MAERGALLCDVFAEGIQATQRDLGSFGQHPVNHFDGFRSRFKFGKQITIMTCLINLELPAAKLAAGGEP